MILPVTLLYMRNTKFSQPTVGLSWLRKYLGSSRDCILVVKRRFIHYINTAHRSSTINATSENKKLISMQSFNQIKRTNGWRSELRWCNPRHLKLEREAFCRSQHLVLSTYTRHTEVQRCEKGFGLSKSSQKKQATSSRKPARIEKKLQVQATWWCIFNYLQ